MYMHFVCAAQVFAHGVLSLKYHEKGLKCQESGLGQHRLQLLSFVIGEHEEFVERSVLRQLLEEERGRVEVCPLYVLCAGCRDSCVTCLVCPTPTYAHSLCETHGTRPSSALERHMVWYCTLYEWSHYCYVNTHIQLALQWLRAVRLGVCIVWS